jgi:uncharacterized protein YlxP (DUF503 family)
MEGLDSIKGKRKVVKSVLGRVKARFNAAASEVGDQDVRDSASLGFAVCGGDAKILDGVLHHILDFVENTADAEVTYSELEIVDMGGGNEGYVG